MKTKGFATLALILISLIVIIGVGSYVATRNNPTPEPEPAVPGPSKPIATSTPTPTEPTTSKSSVESKDPVHIAKAHKAFGFDILKSIKKEEGQKNIFISPSSIALALSMVYNGATGITKTEMDKALALKGLDISDVNKESLGLIKTLKNPDPLIELSVANSIWANKGIDFKQGFLTTVNDYYGAKTSALDFTDSSSPKTINAWASLNTKGKIPTILTEIPKGAVMYLVNAVYFKGDWTKAFDKKLTKNEKFTSAAGIAKDVPLMKRSDKLLYYENADFQSVVLPYGKRERMGMYVFLPKNMDSFIASLSSENWSSWLKKYASKQGTILLPRFKLEYDKELTSALTSLGMGTAFSNSADFSGIGSDLKISAVKHKTYVDVTEEGTEAAAVTSVEVSLTSAMPNIEEPFYMEVNKPFFFAIQDNLTGEMLFMGVIQSI